MAKQKITLDRNWTYLTPTVTIDYPAGEHEVAAEIAKAADEAGVIKKGLSDGSRTAEAGAARAADAAKG